MAVLRGVNEWCECGDTEVCIAWFPFASTSGVPCYPSTCMDFTVSFSTVLPRSLPSFLTSSVVNLECTSSMHCANKPHPVFLCLLE